jgi:hypothetical protein
MEENMEDKNIREKRKQSYKEPDAIDKIERVVSAAGKLYRAVEPVVKKK